MKLVIDEKGYSFELPGMGFIRTPCNIDITRCNISLLISTLTKIGITSYKIIKSPEHDISTLPKNSKVIKADKTKNIVIHKVENSDSSIEIKKLMKQFTELKDFLTKKIVESTAIPPKLMKSHNKKISNKESPVVEELDNDEFIPEIILDDLEMSGSKIEEISMDDNILSDVDILRELKGGNK